MADLKLFHRLNKHIQDNLWLYIITVLCFTIGIVIGVYTSNNMGEYEKNDLVSYLSNFNGSLINGQVIYKEIFVNAIKNNLPLILAIWFLGLTMIGIPIILVIDMFKGFTLGFTMAFMIKGLGMQGLGLSMLMVLPQNIIYIPCLIISSVIAMEFSVSFLKNKMIKQWNNSVYMKIAGYSATFILIFLIMGVGFLLEAYITPNIIRLVAIGSGSGLA